MDPKAWLSSRSRSKDTSNESMRANGKDGKIEIDEKLATKLMKDDQQPVLLLPARWWPDTLPEFESGVYMYI